LEESHPNFIHKKARYRSPSPNTQINQLRRVLDGAGSRNRDSLPQIEINGEKIVTPAESNFTPDEKESGKDVTVILESLNMNGGHWKEKGAEEFNEKVDGGIRPPYGI
jgi:hypothetical protein